MSENSAEAGLDITHKLARLKHAIARAKKNSTGQPSSKEVNHRREGHLLIDKTSWWVASGEEEMEHLEERRGLGAWQVKVVHFVHQRPIQIFFIVLLIIDVLVVFVELYLDAEVMVRVRCASSLVTLTRYLR